MVIMQLSETPAGLPRQQMVGWGSLWLAVAVASFVSGENANNYGEPWTLHLGWCLHNSSSDGFSSALSHCSLCQAGNHACTLAELGFYRLSSFGHFGEMFAAKTKLQGIFEAACELRLRIPFCWRLSKGHALLELEQ